MVFWSNPVALPKSTALMPESRARPITWRVAYTVGVNFAGYTQKGSMYALYSRAYCIHTFACEPVIATKIASASRATLNISPYLERSSLIVDVFASGTSSSFGTAIELSLCSVSLSLSFFPALGKGGTKTCVRGPPGSFPILTDGWC